MTIDSKRLHQQSLFLAYHVHQSLLAWVIPKRKLTVLAREAKVSQPWLWRLSQHKKLDPDRLPIIRLIRVYDALGKISGNSIGGGG